MFADLSDEQQLILLAGPESRGIDINYDSGSTDLVSESNRIYLDQLAHLTTVTQKGRYYAIPLQNSLQSASEKDTVDFVCFQLLGFRPGNKKYLQRITNWAVDIWRGKLMCSVLGTVSVAKMALDSEFPSLPADLSVSFPASCVQPWSVQSMFENELVEHLYVFEDALHESGFDSSALQECCG